MAGRRLRNADRCRGVARKTGERCRARAVAMGLCPRHGGESPEVVLEEAHRAAAHALLRALVVECGRLGALGKDGRGRLLNSLARCEVEGLAALVEDTRRAERELARLAAARVVLRLRGEVVDPPLVPTEKQVVAAVRSS